VAYNNVFSIANMTDDPVKTICINHKSLKLRISMDTCMAILAGKVLKSG